MEQQQPGPAAPAAPTAAGGKYGRYGPQSEEDEALVKQIVDQAAPMYDGVAAELKEAEDPISVVGESAGQITFAVEREAEGQGTNIPDAVAEGMFKKLTQDFLEMAHGMGVIQFKSKEDYLPAFKQAALKAGQTYAQMVKGGGADGQAQAQPAGAGAAPGGPGGPSAGPAGADPLGRLTQPAAGP